jgi:hypothetical protein
MINYRGVEIFHIDCKNLNEQDFINKVRVMAKLANGHKDSSLLGLADYNGVNLTDKIKEFLDSAEIAESLKKYKKFAIIGLSTLQRIALKFFNYALKLLRMTRC